jgi:hypothetical protein
MQVKNHILPYAAIRFLFKARGCFTVHRNKEVNDKVHTSTGTEALEQVVRPIGGVEV